MNQTTNPSSEPAIGEKVDGQDAMLLYGPRPSVTRINPRMVVLALLLVATIGGLALIIGVGGHRRSGSGDDEREPNLVRPSDQVIQSNLVAGFPSDYTFDVRKEFEDVEYEEKPSTRPVVLPATGPSADELAAERERRQRLDALRDEWEKAIDSPVVFASSRRQNQEAGPAPMSAADRPDAETHASPAHDDGIPADAIALVPPDPHAALPEETRRNLQSEKERFLTEGGAVEPYLKKPLVEPLSKYELKAGTLIPGALVTAINTDLPGEIVAQVTENVYDTVCGDYLLVPQGSRLLGKYQSLISNGQNRALVVWVRLILPNGKSIVLDGMPGTDQLGQAGLQDRVDYHLDRVGTAVALSTAIAYGGNLARDDGGSDDDARDVIGDTVAQEASRVGQRFVDRELGVQPTITIRSGWPLRVLVNQDMIFR